jgi:DNA-binding response OmpR family regulator
VNGTPLQAWRILLVEDEFLIARDMAVQLRKAGAEVLGPAPDVDTALRLLADGAAPDAAILDVSLRGTRSFPVANALRDRGVPFVFATGFEDPAMFADYPEVPRCTKPVNFPRLVEALLHRAG